MNPAKSTPVRSQTTTNASTQSTLSKKSSSIEVRLEEEKFSGAPDQCIDLTLRGYHICASNYSPINDERSQLVVNCLKGGALEFYLYEINPQMPYQMVADKLRVRCSTPHI